MIGNDIVDLHLAERESNIYRHGFRDKLFLPHEKDMITKAAHPATMLWLLWSCKESVYKIIHRNTRERKFAPQQLACSLSQYTGTAAAGTVVYQQQLYYFQSRQIGSCIHTHAAVNTSLLQEARIFTQYHLRPDYLQQILTAEEGFYKDEYGVPFIHDRYTGESRPVSVSHHGKYVGVVKLPKFFS
ncbi:4'-phosphopantetheinyl transferase superfamily protein [Chitinophaga sp.]|uniref:4'-phosphopantetheinyl transferase family protein n=1 Tax=Chitinophaga sp. TaxID=1869181 RepID=UPI002F94564D